MRNQITSTACVIALSLTGVGCYAVVSNQNNNNYINSQMENGYEQNQSYMNALSCALAKGDQSVKR